jgi:hypothetical protein
MSSKTDFSARRTEMMTFLRGLSSSEKLVALAYLSNDPAIGARVPNLASAILEMHRHYHKRELRRLAETEQPIIDLRLLARRKGCRLERVFGLPDRWRIHRLQGNIARHPHHNALTLTQALEALRALADKGTPAKT